MALAPLLTYEPYCVGWGVVQLYSLTFLLTHLSARIVWS